MTTTTLNTANIDNDHVDCPFCMAELHPHASICTGCGAHKTTRGDAQLARDGVGNASFVVAMAILTGYGCAALLILMGVMGVLHPSEMGLMKSNGSFIPELLLFCFGAILVGLVMFPLLTKWWRYNGTASNEAVWVR